MSAVRETEPKVGAPAALPCRTVVVVPREPNAVGAAPTPPPRTSALAVNSALDAIVDVEAKYGIPPLVPAVRPVPPLATINVPAKVMTPNVGLLGVRPVVPALKLVTPTLEAAAQAGMPAATVIT
jgi:hypothetical protein